MAVHLTPAKSETRFIPSLSACCHLQSLLAAVSRACYRLQSLLPPPEPATASRACYRLQSSLSTPELAIASRARCRLQDLLSPQELTVASRACYRLQSSLSPPELAAASRAYCRFQSFPISPKLSEPDPTPASLCHPTDRLTRLPARHGANPDLRWQDPEFALTAPALMTYALHGTTENPP